MDTIKTPVRVDRLDGAFPKRGYFLVDAKGIAWFEDTRKAVLDQIALSLNRAGMVEDIAAWLRRMRDDGVFHHEWPADESFVNEWLAAYDKADK